MNNRARIDIRSHLIALATVATASLSLPCAAKTTVSPTRPATLPAIQVYAPTEPGTTHAPGRIPAWDKPFDVNVPEESLGQQGTLALWFKPAENTRGMGKDLRLFESDALSALIKRTSGSTDITISFGPYMTGPSPDGRKRAYSERVLLTHLKKDRWYHAAWTWDARHAEPVRFFLDGVRQETLPPLQYAGQIRHADRKTTFHLGDKGLCVSGLRLSTTPMDNPLLKDRFRLSEQDGYTDEGMRRYNQRFEPDDVDWAHPIYATRFESPAVLKDWRLEGGRRMIVADGQVALESNEGSNHSQTEANHLVCWLAREIPADFLLEFGVRPKNRRQGLNIVFFNARGLNGESIFAPTLQSRNGLFQQYHSGDLNNYHVSYWSGGRGSSNLRKNRGFQLAAIGEDLVEDAPADRFQTIRIYKRGGMIRLTVDGRLALGYDDDGKILGPVHIHSGWIGLRQMAHTLSCEYDHLTVYPLLGSRSAPAPATPIFPQPNEARSAQEK